MMRLHVVFVAAVFTFGAVACSSGSDRGGDGDSDGSNGDGDGDGPGSDGDDDETGSGGDTGTGGDGSDGGSELASEASCFDICEPYLECKGLDTSYQVECTEACFTQQFTEAELDSYEGLDCFSLVEAIETARPGSGDGTGGSGNDDYQQSQECAYGECVRDGDYCVTFGTVTSDCPQACCD